MKNAEDFAILVGLALRHGFSYKSEVTEQELRTIVARGRAEAFMSKGTLRLNFLRGNRSYGVLHYGEPYLQEGEWCVYLDESKLSDVKK